MTTANWKLWPEIGNSTNADHFFTLSFPCITKCINVAGLTVTMKLYISPMLFGFIYFPSSGLNRTKSHIRISLFNFIVVVVVDVFNRCAPKKKHCKMRLSKNKTSRIFITHWMSNIKFIDTHSSKWIKRKKKKKTWAWSTFCLVNNYAYV